MTAEPSSEKRPRSTTLLIAFAATVVIAGLFVAGFLVGNASTSTPVTTTTTTAGTSAPGSANGSGTTTAPSARSGVCGSSNACIINSSAGDTVVQGAPFSFTVTTAGSPVPRLRKTGRLPRGVHFVNNHNGTATFFGTPISTAKKSVVGTYPLTLIAEFGRGAPIHVVTQAFTLTVTG